MAFRSFRERLLQAAAFEIGGLLIATPLYGAATGQPMAESAALIAALAVAVLIWTPLYNLAFDRVEWRLTRRVASDRPARLRLLHALGHEVSALVATLPILIHFGGLSLIEALLADLGLSLLYAVWAFVFYRIFDWLRPVRPAFAKDLSR